jgi:gamma-glutamyltranspeptidase/glutathione hydrolase
MVWVRFAILLLVVVAPETSPSRAFAASSPGTGMGAVATANPAATAAALKMLEARGSAIDAAIAAQMVLGVVEPQSSGLGGGAIILFREPGQSVVRAFDGLSGSPAGYDPKLSAQDEFSHSGAAVGIPGALSVLELMHRRYGILPWATLFAPAIELASSGFPVSPYLARSIVSATRSGFVPPSWLRDPSGKAVVAGAVVKNPDLAALMARIAERDSGVLYLDLAPEIAAAVKSDRLAGALAGSDLSAYRPVERTPICTRYRAINLCAFPPPSYGGIEVLERLLLLDRLQPGPPNFLNAEFVHKFIEAGRIAESDRLDIVGDPDTGATSILPLISSKYLDERAGSIEPASALKNPVPPGNPDGLSRPKCSSSSKPKSPSTSQVAIVDPKGGALTMTTTINVNFGSWIEVKGFFLNDAMTNFAFESDSGCAANRGAPNKRAETAMAPIIGMDAERETVIVGGSAGGGEIVDYVAQALVQIGNGATALEALDAGHVSTAKAPYPESAGVVEVEQGRGIAELAPRLRSLGHKIEIKPLNSGLAFLVKGHNGWSGAADPRRDGNAAVTVCCR